MLAHLLDHLIGEGDDSRRDVKADGLRSLQIDDEFQLGGLLDRQVAGLLAPENTAEVDSGVARRVEPV
jgi:hypothetical protein